MAGKALAAVALYISGLIFARSFISGVAITKTRDDSTGANLGEFIHRAMPRVHK